MIAFLLLGIEEIGVQIEEPFAILPLGLCLSPFTLLLLLRWPDMLPNSIPRFR